MTLRTSAAAGRQVAEFVCSLAESVGLAESAAYRLRLAADEIVTNIGLHGYCGRPGPVELVGGVEADAVWLSIIDEAPRVRPDRPRPGTPARGRSRSTTAKEVSGCSSRCGDWTTSATAAAGGRNKNTLTMRQAGGRAAPRPRWTETS